jgi:hypothetical protein
MQNATHSNYVPRHSQRLVVFPGNPAAARARTSDSRTQFERLLIFVLCTLWAIGMVMWSLVYVWGFGHGPASSLALHSLSVPTSLPTVQSATIFAVRLMLGW